MRNEAYTRYVAVTNDSGNAADEGFSSDCKPLAIGKGLFSGYFYLM